jgi:hypothetical protein
MVTCRMPGYWDAHAETANSAAIAVAISARLISTPLIGICLMILPPVLAMVKRQRW